MPFINLLIVVIIKRLYDEEDDEHQSNADHLYAHRAAFFSNQLMTNKAETFQAAFSHIQRICFQFFTL